MLFFFFSFFLHSVYTYPFLLGLVTRVQEYYLLLYIDLLHIHSFES